MFIVSSLPNRTDTSQASINLFRCVAFEGLYKLGQCLLTAELDNGVDMIWHHNHTKPSESLFRFEPVKGLKNDVCDFGSCEQWFFVKCGECEVTVGTGY